MVSSALTKPANRRNIRLSDGLDGGNAMRSILIAVIPALVVLAPSIASAAAAPVAIPADVEVIKDVEYGKVGDYSLKLDILRPAKQPKQPLPVVVWIHGGGWRSGDKGAMTKTLLPFVKHGYCCVSINYRFSTVATFPAQVQDCKCSIRFLRAHAKQYNIDPDRIGVWGGSAGGYLVAMLGTTAGVKEFEGDGGWQSFSSRPNAVCDLYGITDIPAIDELVKEGKATQRFMTRPSSGDTVSPMLGVPYWEAKDLAVKASPITYVSKDDPPFLIMHGDRDPLTPMSQGARLNSALRKVGVDSTLRILTGAGHGFAGRPDCYLTAMKFFDAHLKPKAKQH